MQGRWGRAITDSQWDWYHPWHYACATVELLLPHMPDKDVWHEYVTYMRIMYRTMIIRLIMRYSYVVRMYSWYIRNDCAYNHKAHRTMPTTKYEDTIVLRSKPDLRSSGGSIPLRVHLEMLEKVAPWRSSHCSVFTAFTTSTHISEFIE